MGSEIKKMALVDQQSAVRVYLDALLTDVPDNVEAGLETVSVSMPEVALEQEVGTTEKIGTVVKADSPAIPVWAQSGFQCLMSQVSGLTLAVPLEGLSGVGTWGDELTSLPGKPEWFLGILPYQGTNSVIVNTSMLVFPQKLKEKIDDKKNGYGNIVFINEGRWGLACDSVAEVITLTPAEVKWRSAQGQRPWLAGTVIEQMCALLDVGEFSNLLERGAVV